MSVSTRDDLKRLFLLNRWVLDSEQLSEVERIERDWIVRRVAEIEAEAPEFPTRSALVKALQDVLERARTEPSESADFLARQATREQFKVVVAEFAIDALTESQNMFPIILRLPIKSQMAVMRILIDEFGCGNLEQAHSKLYGDLLAELEMPGELEAYLDVINDQSYRFLNMFYWLTMRAPAPEYFLGAFAYFEASIPHAFECWEQACARLGIANSRYYSEHRHIDTFHMKEMQTAIRELANARGADYKKVWAGIRLAHETVGDAFEAAVAKARSAA
jgi:Iron-containing redox enzyme